MKKYTFEDIEKAGLLIYSYIRGSHVYGLAKPDGTSDIDTGAIYLAPAEQLLGLGLDYQEQIASEKNDDTWIELTKFMNLLLKSNPTVLEALFIPDRCITYEHPIMTEIKKYRDKFITKECFKPIIGYSYEQIKKCRGLNKRFLSASPSEIQKQIQEILVGETRAIMATMPIEDINADRTTFLSKVRESLEQELTKIGFDVTNINISEITDTANYIVNMGKRASTRAQANAEADIAEQQKVGAIKIANTQKEKDIAVSQAERDKEISVNQAKQEQEVKVAEINREKQIKLAEAEKERESGIALQEAEKVANIAKANAEAESKKAEYESLQTKNIAKAEADAEAAQNEAEALKQVRIAKARQDQEAETIKATQEKEAKAAEYESNKRQRKAEQDKLAGVAEQKAKIDVAKARAEAGKAEADSIKVSETAKVEAEMSVAKTKQERQLEVNEAEAKAQEAKLNAVEIIPAEKAKEKAIIAAEATKKTAELEAEATKARILREAEAEAERIRLAKNAEAEGTKNILMAEAEGKRDSLLAEAEAEQQKALAEAMAFERMIQAAGSPEMAVHWKMADKWEGIAGAQANALSRINLGNVTVYGDKTTGGQFAKSIIENLAPALSMVNEGVKGQFLDLFNKSGKKTEELPTTFEKE